MEKLSLEAYWSGVDFLHYSLPTCLHVVQVGAHHRASQGDGPDDHLDERQLSYLASHLLTGVLCISGSEEVVGAVCEASLA